MKPLAPAAVVDGLMGSGVTAAAAKGPRSVASVLQVSGDVLQVSNVNGLDVDSGDSIQPVDVDGNIVDGKNVPSFLEMISSAPVSAKLGFQHLKFKDSDVFPPSFPHTDLFDVATHGIPELLPVIPNLGHHIRASSSLTSARDYFFGDGQGFQVLQDRLYQYLLAVFRAQQLARAAHEAKGVVDVSALAPDGGAKTPQEIRALKAGLSDFALEEPGAVTALNDAVGDPVAAKTVRFFLLLYCVVRDFAYYPKQITKVLSMVFRADGAEEWSSQHWEFSMGMGKTQVMAPLTSAVHADGKHLSVVVFIESQYQTGLKDLQNFLSALGRQAVGLEYERSTHSKAKLTALADVLRHSVLFRRITATRVKDLHCLGVMDVVTLEQVHDRAEQVTGRAGTEWQLSEQFMIIFLHPCNKSYCSSFHFIKSPAVAAWVPRIVTHAEVLIFRITTKPLPTRTTRADILERVIAILYEFLFRSSTI